MAEFIFMNVVRITQGVGTNYFGYEPAMTAIVDRGFSCSIVSWQNLSHLRFERLPLFMVTPWKLLPFGACEPASYIGSGILNNIVIFRRITSRALFWRSLMYANVIILLDKEL